uniref:Peptidase S1 domain-containing protein n=1 Tax=Strigamia maritima TaxID=126957 RepID=T1JDK5_STRMM
MKTGMFLLKQVLHHDTWQVFILLGGYDWTNPKTIDELMPSKVPILSLNKCRNAYGAHSVLSSVICAGWTEGKKDSCEGDSGGPLVWQENQRWYLIGLVSWGYGCARPNYPAIYTRTDYYYDWIDLQTKGSKFCTT